MLTTDLAELIIETRDVPSEVLAESRVSLIDTIGVALAGLKEPVCKIAFEQAIEHGGIADAVIWGTNHAVPAPEAAFVNGIAAHALDFDDTMPNLRGHPSATMLPAAMAIASISSVSGAELLTSYALGFEVAGKLGRAFGSGHYMRGWHATATIGAFTATAVAGRLAGLTVEQLMCAWGLAAAQAGGLVSNFGTMAKPFQVGHAARAAVNAVLLARRGFTANAQILDDPQSFLSVYAANGEPLATALQYWGKPWELQSPGNYYKRWPCCYCNHRPVGMLLEMLKEHSIEAGEIVLVQIGFPPGTDEPLIHKNPQTGLTSKFSIEYSAAAAILDRKLTLETFTDDMVCRPQVRALMQKVERYRISDDKIYSGTVGYNDLTIHTKNRGQFSRRVDKTPGSAEWPMSSSDHREKFLDCASRVFHRRQASNLLDFLYHCEQSDTSKFAQQLQPAIEYIFQ